jgi:2-polyprenyl-6-hydroxyphenyl methylase/3-demethylubiquinone-9 3-methyltransferase
MYSYNHANLGTAHSYLLPAVLKALEREQLPDRTLFDLGCGNGSVANEIDKLGFCVKGIDLSEEGIQQANRQFPKIELHVGSAYDDLTSRYGRFGCVLSLEVVEHLYNPRLFTRNLYELLQPGGIAIVSTPYHGYWKNLALSVTNSMDSHFTALWDGGHIKFWSVKTLGVLLKEAGFTDIKFTRVGRIPAFAKSMIAIAKR